MAQAVAYEKPVKVGKVERYTYGVSAWLNGETLTAVSVAECGSFITVSAHDIDAGTIGWFATGVSAGVAEVIINYATATRSDSIKLFIVVLDADVCSI